MARAEKISEIVAGGGWVVRQVVGRPKTRLFLSLSLAWLGVSVPASSFFLDGWPGSFSAIEFFALLLIAPHPIFIALAVWFSRTERPCIIERQLRNPDYDARKLY